MNQYTLTRDVNELDKQRIANRNETEQELSNNKSQQQKWFLKETLKRNL